MKITIESTTKITRIELTHGQSIECRVWEGETERGVKIQCLIPRIAALADQDLAQFEAELQEQRAPCAVAQAFPLRMIL